MIRIIFAAFLVLACTAAPPAATIQPTGTPRPTATAVATATTAPTTPPTTAPTTAPTATPSVPLGTPALPTASPSPTVEPTAANTMTIGTAKDSSGADYLVGPDGLALYTNDNDTATTSSCTGGCAGNWPPLAVDPGATIDAPGVTGTFTTLSRTDGTTQLVYNGSPLYNFVGDSAAGDTNGDGISGIWHLARP